MNNPEPENPRLLTDEEICDNTDFETYRDYRGRGCTNSTYDVYPLLKAQDAKTARFIKGSADA